MRKFLSILSIFFLLQCPVIAPLVIKSEAQVVFGIAKSGFQGLTGIDFAAGKDIVWMGDSYINHYNVTLAQGFTTLFSLARGSTQTVMGVNGASMQGGSICSTFPIDPATIPTYNSLIHCALIIGIGTNDVGWNGAGFISTTFKTTYQTFLTTAIATKGWPPSLIVLLNTYKLFNFAQFVGACPGHTITTAPPSRSADYNTKISELCVTNGVWYVDMYSAMNGLNSSYFNVDQLHPNVLGYQYLADFLINLLDIRWFVVLIAVPTMIRKRGKIISMSDYKKAAA